MSDVPTGYQRLADSERRPAANATRIGAADANETFSVTIVLRRRPDGPPMPGIDGFATTSQQTIQGNRPRLSQEEFEANYGASQDDIAKVVAFAREHNLNPIETNPARRTVVVSGSVAQMNAAFGVDLGRYRRQIARKTGENLQTETYRGREGFIHVPTDLADIIVGVFGLDNRRITKRNSGDPPNTATLTVPQITKLYNFPPNGASGQTIAILSEAGYQMGDITQYQSTLPAGFPPFSILDISVDAGNDGSADGETTQDICIAASAAPGAAIAVYFTTPDQQGWVDLVSRVIHPSAGDPTCSVLSSSFYVSNGDDTQTLLNEGVSVSWVKALTQAFQDASVQQVTICIASGDAGTDSKVGDGKAHVQYPASDPWVLSVGGTTVGNVSGATYDEYVWNDTFFGGQSGATGGGISDYFGLPSYQNAAGVPPSLNDGTHIGRGVPDVSANASPNSGYPLNVGGSPAVANGTSASAPLWAGLIAVINMALGHNVGFVNPKLYLLGSSGFRDIGGALGPADNGLNGVQGYPAGTGWDACTGLGSINGVALLSGLQRLSS